MSALQAPLAMLAELTHRCPLQCPYCSNPVQLEAARNELSTETWQRVIREAAALGVLQIHFSGGEPTARRDLASLVAHATDHGLHTNLITSGMPLTRERFATLVDAGLEHVQLSVQDSDAKNADRIGGVRNANRKKQEVAKMVCEAGLPLTVNAVMHRQNLDHLEDVIALAVNWGAQRLEIAHAQYYGWALVNRAALLPTRRQLDEANRIVEAAKARLDGVIAIDYVVPDYYGRRPKACMGGWGNHFFNVTPSGKVLPCHAAETIGELEFDTVQERYLGDIWHRSSAFERFRGTGWMPEPCRSCELREVDWGGCRCQALALTGDAASTDPVCELSPQHPLISTLTPSEEASEEFIPRNPQNVLATADRLTSVRGY